MNFRRHAHKSWHSLDYFFHSPQFKKLIDHYRDNSVQPSIDYIFQVFETPVSQIKVVLLGNKPFNSPNLSQGLAYSVNTYKGHYKPLDFFYQNMGIEENTNLKDLKYLQNQGVFLLNRVLTIETDGTGRFDQLWKEFTNIVVRFLSIKTICVWLIPGKENQDVINHIANNLVVNNYKNVGTIPTHKFNQEQNYVIKTENVFSKNFTTDSCFTKTNLLLKKKKLKEIEWNFKKMKKQ